MTSRFDVAAKPVGAVAARRGVPWWTVVPLALVMAYADGFWMISLRGAAGAVERTDAPFDTWLRESTLSLPVFLLAVLGALTLALRWFGPAPRGIKHLGTALMVVVAGTLAGITEIAASSAYDYHLQSRLLLMMNSMRGACAGGTSCLDQLQVSSMDLQFRAVGVGSVLVLVSNLVAVGWVMAFRGRRVDVTTRRVAPRGLPTALTLLVNGARTSRVDDVRLLMVTGLVGSAFVHAAVVPEHLAEWGAAGVFFVGLTAAELAVAGMVLVRRQTAATLAALVSIAPLLLWSYSRTFGMPFGPNSGAPEAVGLADCAACALELATLIAAVVLLRREGWLRQRPAWSEHVAWLIVVAVISVTVIGVAGSSLGWFSVIGAQMTMTSG